MCCVNLLSLSLELSASRFRLLSISSSGGVAVKLESLVVGKYITGSSHGRRGRRRRRRVKLGFQSTMQLEGFFVNSIETEKKHTTFVFQKRRVALTT